MIILEELNGYNKKGNNQRIYIFGNGWWLDFGHCIALLS